MTKSKALFQDLEKRLGTRYNGQVTKFDYRLWHPLLGMKSCFSYGKVSYISVPPNNILLPMQLHIRVSRDDVQVGDVLSILHGHMNDNAAMYKQIGLVVCIVNIRRPKDYLAVWRWRPNCETWDVPNSSSICVSEFVTELGVPASRPMHSECRVDYVFMA